MRTRTRSVRDLRVRGVVHPGTDDVRGIEVDGLLDTRAMDRLLDHDAEPGLVCALLDAADLPCVACGATEPGDFCVPFEAHGLTAARAPEAKVHARSCQDVLHYHSRTGACGDIVSLWDRDEDGVYEACGVPTIDP